MKPAKKYFTYSSIKKSGATYRHYDTIVCKRTDLTCDGVVPTSRIISNFAYPPKQVAARQKLTVKLHVSCEKWNNNRNYRATGGTISSADLLSKRVSLKDVLSGDYKQYRVRRFENYDCSTGVSRWYSLMYNNANYGSSWTDRFYVEMPAGKKVGEKLYLMMDSDAAVHWYTYTWKAIN